MAHLVLIDMDRNLGPVTREADLPVTGDKISVGGHDFTVVNVETAATREAEPVWAVFYADGVIG